MCVCDTYVKYYVMQSRLKVLPFYTLVIYVVLNLLLTLVYNIIYLFIILIFLLTVLQYILGKNSNRSLGNYNILG